MPVRALVDGHRTDTIPVTDSSVFRGDGCFEAIRSYDGRLFALDEHLQRLGRSAAALGIQLPRDDRVGSWCRAIAAEGGEGIVRVAVTRGDCLPGTNAPSRIVVVHHPVGYLPATVRLLPVVAPWHGAGRDWELAGAKTLSYAPNMSASWVAHNAGFDDAVLVSSEGLVLEGPTFSVAWVVGGVVETPSLELGILDSITRRHVIAVAAEQGIDVTEGGWDLGRVHGADEILVMSTVKEVAPVVSVGDRQFEPGPVTDRLRQAFRRRVAQSISPQGGVGR